MQIDFFGAPWCNACHGQLDHWKKAAEKYGHTLNYIDVEKHPEEAGESGVSSLPTIFIGEARYLGMRPEEIDKVCSSL